MHKTIGKFIGLYLAIVAFVYGIFPIGIAVFIAARIVYGSWSDAIVAYGTHMGMAASSILGLIPIYGNKLHYTLSQNHLTDRGSDKTAIYLPKLTRHYCPFTCRYGDRIHTSHCITHH